MTFIQALLIIFVLAFAGLLGDYLGYVLFRHKDEEIKERLNELEKIVSTLETEVTVLNDEVF